MRSTSSRLGAMTLVLLACAVPAPPTVAAAPDTDEHRAGALEVSRDGVVWEAEYPGSLFGSELVLVPGAPVIAAVHVRNATDEVATLRARVVDVVGGTAVEHAVFSTSVAGGAAERRSLATLRSRPELALFESLAPGATVRLDVSIELPVGTPNLAQSDRLSFVLVVELGGESVRVPTQPPVPGPESQDPGASLPSTGAVIARSLAVAALLAAIGLAVRSLARRRLRSA